MPDASMPRSTPCAALAVPIASSSGCHGSAFASITETVTGGGCMVAK